MEGARPRCSVIFARVRVGYRLGHKRAHVEEPHMWKARAPAGWRPCQGRQSPRNRVRLAGPRGVQGSMPPASAFRPAFGAACFCQQGLRRLSPAPGPAQEIFRFLKNPRKPAILAMSRPDAKKNITTLVKAFGENQMLRELANLVLIMVRRRRRRPRLGLRSVLQGASGFAPARQPGAHHGAPPPRLAWASKGCTRVCSRPRT